MRNAQEVDKHSAPEPVAIVSELAPQGALAAAFIGTLELCDDS
jgi:hypothetical protein